jgi:hypothetical protein
VLDYIYSGERKKEKAWWHRVEMLSGEKVEEQLKPLFSELEIGGLKSKPR